MDLMSSDIESSQCLENRSLANSTKQRGQGEIGGDLMSPAIRFQPNVQGKVGGLPHYLTRDARARPHPLCVPDSQPRTKPAIGPLPADMAGRAKRRPHGSLP